MNNNCDLSELTKLNELLEESITIYRNDRDLALENYNDIKRQLENILNGDFEMSEEAKLESEKNKALKLLFESSKRLDNVIARVTDVITTQLNNESREKIADKIGSNFGDRKPKGPVDFTKLRNRTQQLEMDEDDENEEC